MKGMDAMPIINEQQHVEQVIKAYEPHKERLGAERFEALVNEISAATWDALVKLDAYPWNGGLDGYEAEKRQIGKERTMKVLLIKQKYGI
ncbi:hypothetical protein D1872_223810 [compost metagenome]